MMRRKVVGRWLCKQWNSNGQPTLPQQSSLAQRLTHAWRPFLRPSAGLAIGLAALVLAACGSEPAKPTEVRHEIRASENLNMNIYEQSMPVYIQVFYLADIDAFKKASTYQLDQHPTEVLGKGLIKKARYFVKPGSLENFDITIPEGTHYIAVSAEFRDSNQTNHKTFVKLPKDEGGEYKLFVDLKGFNLTLELD